MSRDHGGSEQRRSFRCGVPAGQETATLEVGPERFPARLLDESVEGAGVRAEGNLDVKPQDVVRLSTTLGRFEARVIYVSQIDPSRPDGGGEAPQYRLGLEWLREPSTSVSVETYPPQPR
jgi:hypothetical protein